MVQETRHKQQARRSFKKSSSSSSSSGTLSKQLHVLLADSMKTISRGGGFVGSSSCSQMAVPLWQDSAALAIAATAAATAAAAAAGASLQLMVVAVIVVVVVVVVVSILVRAVYWDILIAVGSFLEACALARHVRRHTLSHTL
jgi:hypothetical protein